MSLPTTAETSEEVESFAARDYQLELLEKARDRNIIVPLGTGSGKTYIAVMLMREFAHHLRAPYENGGKRIAFLVCTKPLVKQQAEQIRRHTDLEVAELQGDQNVMNAQNWNEILRNKQVFVITAQLFHDILQHGFCTLDRFCLLVFDECHHAQGDAHPYRLIGLKYHEMTDKSKTRILGLTASVINNKTRPGNLESEMRTLESVLGSTIETTDDILSTYKFAAQPKIYIISCKNYDCKEMCAEVFGCIQRVLDFCKNADFNPDFELDPTDPVCRCLKRMMAVLENLGPWVLSMVYPVWEKQLEKFKKCALTEEQKQFFILGLTCMKQVGCLLRRRVAGIRSEKDALPFLPDKVVRLLRLLQQLKPNNGRRSFSGIIFAEQRVVALALKRFLVRMSELESEQYGFIKVDWITGHGGSGFGLPDDMKLSLQKRQEQVLRAFRSERLNLLIATSVLEEGVDVRHCNAVIRFDKPMNYRAYIQSKGRARMANSIFAIFIDENEHEGFSSELRDYAQIEKVLLRHCCLRANANPPELTGLGSNDLLEEPFCVKSAKITLDTAVQLVNRYCGKLPGDRFTRFKPRTKTETILVGDDKVLYACSIFLPINSLVKKVVRGKEMPSERLAEKSAALQVCRELYALGELDDHLLPVGRDSETVTQLLMILDCNKDYETAAGTVKHRQNYHKKVAECLGQEPLEAGTDLYVYEIGVLGAQWPNDRPFGICLRNRLPTMPQFPLYTAQSHLRVQIGAKVFVERLSAERLSLLSNFHEYLFSNVLGLAKSSMQRNPRTPLMVCPLKSNKNGILEFDWAFMDEVLSNRFSVAQKPTDQERRAFVFNKTRYLDAIVVPWYRELDFVPFYSVAGVCEQLRPSSPFPDKEHRSFNEYYKTKYQLDIMHQSQPLLAVENTSERLNFLAPSLAKYKNVPNERKWKLVPELVNVFPMPVFIWNSIRILPSVLYRLNALLLADEFRIRVHTEAFGGSNKTDIDWPPLVLERYAFNKPKEPLLDASFDKADDVETSDTESDKEETSISSDTEDWIDEQIVIDAEFERHLAKYRLKPDETEEKMEVDEDVVDGIGDKMADLRLPKLSRESFELDKSHTNPHGPSPSLLLQALTMQRSNDGFNLERLETIGDSFLKYATSVFLYLADTNINEGSLSFLRSKQISNARLFEVATNKSIPQIMVADKFEPRHNWLPPGYNCIASEAAMTEDDQAEEVSSYLTEQRLGDKSVADAIEALIGVYLLTYGPRGAVHFMNWLGLKTVSPDTQPMWPDPLLRYESEPESQLLDLWEKCNLGELESALGYTFNNRAHLLQAMTHASYYENRVTDCYQRLEFLGDAVLDYLITHSLYNHKRNYSPGDLTDLRSAIVNNTMFASLAVKNKLHVYFRHMCPALCGAIDKFAQIQNEKTEAVNFDQMLCLNDEQDGEEGEDIEVPKALGDLLESVAGAIFLDSGGSLDTVWRILYPLLKDTMDKCCANPPKTPVRQLMEKYNARVRFSTWSRDDSGRIRVFVDLGSDVDRFVGLGKNARLARCAAAKKALRALKAQ